MRFFAPRQMVYPKPKTARADVRLAQAPVVGGRAGGKKARRWRREGGRGGDGGPDRGDAAVADVLANLKRSSRFSGEPETARDGRPPPALFGWRVPRTSADAAAARRRGVGGEEAAAVDGAMEALIAATQRPLTWNGDDVARVFEPYGWSYADGEPARSQARSEVMTSEVGFPSLSLSLPLSLSLSLCLSF